MVPPPEEDDGRAGVVECVLEKGLYRLYHNGAVRMVIQTHVDGLLVAMDTSSMHAKEVLQKMTASLHLKGSDGISFAYLARNFTRRSPCPRPRPQRTWRWCL